MKLCIKNVAKIKEANIEIEGITVIAGYNGTGKSTISKSLFGIIDSYYNLDKEVYFQRINSISSQVYKWDIWRKLKNFGFWEFDVSFTNEIIKLNKNYRLDILTYETFKELFEKAFIKTVAKTGLKNDMENSKFLNDNELQVLCDDINKIIETPNEAYVSFIIEKNIRNVFSNQINNLRKSNEKAVIEVLVEKDKLSVEFLDNRLTQFTKNIINVSSPIYIETKSILDNFKSDNMNRSLSDSNLQIQRFLEKENAKTKENITLQEYQDEKEKSEIIQHIIEKVTNGKLILNDQEELSYKEDGLEHPISCSNIASGLKNFLVIQRIVENGHLTRDALLIIDEPEVNLHPEWQLQFAEILVLLSKSLDIKILINTHSPYFTRAIETFTAKNGYSENSRYYLTKELGDKTYTAENVTSNTDLIYLDLYKPLEKL